MTHGFDTKQLSLRCDLEVAPPPSARTDGRSRALAFSMNQLYGFALAPEQCAHTLVSGQCEGHNQAVIQYERRRWK